MKCHDGYKLEDGKCVCSSIVGCYNCPTSTTCTICKFGYLID